MLAIAADFFVDRLSFPRTAAYNNLNLALCCGPEDLLFWGRDAEQQIPRAARTEWCDL